MSSYFMNEYSVQERNYSNGFAPPHGVVDTWYTVPNEEVLPQHQTICYSKHLNQNDVRCTQDIFIHLKNLFAKNHIEENDFIWKSSLKIRKISLDKASESIVMPRIFIEKLAEKNLDYKFRIYEPKSNDMEGFINRLYDAHIKNLPYHKCSLQDTSRSQNTIPVENINPQVIQNEPFQFSQNFPPQDQEKNLPPPFINFESYEVFLHSYFPDLKEGNITITSFESPRNPINNSSNKDLYNSYEISNLLKSTDFESPPSSAILNKIIKDIVGPAFLPPNE